MWRGRVTKGRFKQGPVGHVKKGYFSLWRGIGGHTKPSIGNEICGTCNHRLECAFFRKGTSIDTCDDYIPDATTIICNYCHKLTIITSQYKYKCWNCGTRLNIPLAKWQIRDLSEEIKKFEKDPTSSKYTTWI